MIKLGLTSRLSILLVCIGVAASGATGYYAYRANRATIMQEAERNLLTSTQLLSQRFTAALGDAGADALVLATMPAAATLARGDAWSDAGRDRLEQVFVRFMVHHPEYLEIRLITQFRHGLERIRVERGVHGIAIVPESELREKGQFPYVFDALATKPGDVYLSPIGLEAVSAAGDEKRRPAMRIASPIVDENGDKVGVLVLDLDLTQVFQRLEMDLPADYLVYLANQWGDFLIHPDPNQTFGFERGRRVLMQASFPATRAIFEGGRTTLTFDGPARPDEAPTHAFAFVRSSFGDVEGNRFIVLGLARAMTNVLASANALGARIVRIVLISSAVAIVLATLFAGALARPLRTLARAATHVFDDSIVERLPVGRSDEIGVLARCFDVMRSEIRTQMKTLQTKQQELAHLAGHDTLTGLPNRMRFMEQLDAAIRQAAVNGERLAVMFIDLDGFKQINDQLGHSAGDRTLAVVAQRLRGALHGGDIAARLGGDEFVILVSGVRSIDAIREAADRVQAAMSETMMLGSHRVTVGASMGISEFPVDGDQAEELLVKADAAMYAAKTSSQRRYVRYQELTANEPSADYDDVSRRA
ncbi:diguanylate cyclase domain-containing protein [Trinickia sp.]|uniref:diguanylate cyclase domain-containing protein n=1 Tax=Trinickia sp. TaxID=2571163 RepID=UPI003F7E05EC